ncbi:hypothetical protein MKEN_00281600 [Mycena kentingensis (nom. inval.)]|nr:hypothetical protein MKEN_00281600 [Mycena kentingensis (nom. inval.)]
MTSTNANNQQGLGTKIKGAAEAVHGMGENVRGTLLGGVDTVFHHDSTTNDTVAARGRDEARTGAERAFGVEQSVPTYAYGKDPTHLGTMTDTVPARPKAPSPPPLPHRAGEQAGSELPTRDPAAAAVAPAIATQPGYVEHPGNPGPAVAHAHPNTNTNVFDPQHDPQATAQRIPSYAGPATVAQDFAPTSTGIGHAHPQHHRDDAHDLDKEVVGGPTGKI